MAYNRLGDFDDSFDFNFHIERKGICDDRPNKKSAEIVKNYNGINNRTTDKNNSRTCSHRFSNRWIGFIRRAIH